VSAAARIALALVLVAAAALKLRSPGAGTRELATFSVPRAARPAVWSALIVVELGLAVTVGAGSDTAALAAAGVYALFAVALAVAVLLGRTGAPCGCFGARSRVSLLAAMRSGLLAGAFAALPWLPDGWPSTEGWLALGLGLSFALVLLLGVAVLALAREVGLMRLRIGGEPALEIPEEGPAIGERLGLIERFRPDGRARFALAVFSSEGCSLCRRLEPVIAAFQHDPLVSVAVFDEVHDADIWRELDIPGSPFAIALGRDGAVGAKGTFNSYGQLEGILATAERRLAEARG
jgi:hypothetical protein